MKQEDLIKICDKLFNQWFFKIRALYLKGSLSAPSEIHCADEIQIFESPDHFIIELLGTQPLLSFKSLIVKNKIIKVGDTTSHIIGGPKFKNLHEKKSFSVFENCRIVHLKNCDLSSGFGEEVRNNLLPQNIKDYDLNDFEIPIYIDQKCNFIFIDNCQFAYEQANLKYFYRSHSLTLIIKRNTKKEALESFLISKFSSELKPDNRLFMGVFYDPEQNQRFRQELLTLAHQPVHETRIDAFINKYNNLFAEALNYKTARSNIELKIVEGIGWSEASLIPDYLMENHNGGFDILDLKLGLIDRSLTVNEKSRRKLSSYCQDLVAQLGGYLRYFKSEKNRQWAFDNYGIVLNNSPMLIGVIGNQNNFVREEIDEALELNPNVRLISYNEICDFLSGKTRFTE